MLKLFKPQNNIKLYNQRPKDVDYTAVDKYFNTPKTKMLDNSQVV